MKKIIVFILIIAAVLVSIWFKDGYILGTAEDGLIFYNISNYFHQAQYTWMEYPGLGSPSLYLIAAKPTFLLLSYLQHAGLPGFLIQAGVMLFILISSGIGVYLLVKELFPKLPDKYLLLGILFYWFNPISLADVWNRFLLNYIFFFALLPVGSYFYIKGLRDRRYIWILVLNVALIFYSYAFSYVAFSILFWIWLFLITFFYYVFNKNGPLKIFSFEYLFLNLIVFSISNCWWILPLIFLNISGGVNPTVSLFLSQNNTGLLDALSKSVGNLNGIFKLTNASFLSADSLDWVKIYSSPLLYFVMFIIVGSILCFLIKFRKDPTILFLGSLFLTAIFLSKGNNPPFGEIYNFIYEKIIFLQVFRNPFEKFGFLLSLTSTVLLGSSIFELTKQFRSNFRRLIYPFFFVVIFFYLGFPLFTGLAFTNKFPPTNNYSIGYKVKVPEYYKDINDWLSRQDSDFRYIGLPLKDEGITYNWEKGYAGVELNVALFSNSGIIHNTSVPFFKQVVPEIEQSLLSDNDFSNLANLVNARYYLLRYDIDYKLRAMTDPVIVEQALVRREKKGEVKKVANFGQVSIWENLKWKDSTFYLARNIERVKSFDNNADITDINISKGDILIRENTLLNIQGIDQSILPSISYEKINLTKYIVHLRNSTKPYLLFFSELYNDAWKASFKSGEAVDNHFRANIYGNGWLISREGDFDIVIEFTPQRWMDLGEKVSLGSYVLMLGFVLFLLISNRKSET